ncbi:MAG: methionyl-tRNA formyltransferase [Clostridia bacterium]|nr:methionyl-tRNA formyltransferase [Clostridia bacterium]
MRIMFMGTPDIARETLATLLRRGHDIVAVVTREDKVRGRGNATTPTPVKALALEHGIPVYTPSTLRDETFASLLSEYDPELIAVVAYGKILPKSVLDYPKHGCLNLHVSLLPAYRGAAPIQRSVMDGNTETGVTVMYMDEGLDTGDIISRAVFEISPTDTAGDIHDRAAEVGSELLSSAIYDIEAGRATRTPQDHALATYAAKIEKEDCRVDFSLPAFECNCRIRGVTPFPGAFCFLGERQLKILDAIPFDASESAPFGTVVAVSGTADGYIDVACGGGILRLTRLKPEGKGAMSAGDFVRGRKIAVGDVLK